MSIYETLNYYLFMIVRINVYTLPQGISIYSQMILCLNAT